MIERLIENKRDLKRLLNYLQAYKLPFRITVRDGRSRSLDQNRLQWLWATEAAQQRGDVDAQDVQAEWKLRFGVPMLLADQENIASIWRKVEEKFTYEEQIELMHIWPVTSTLTMTQLSRYLDRVYQWNCERGIELTDPEDLCAPTSR